MSSRETFAGVALSGRIVMSGAPTGLEMLEQALANWPILESTRKMSLISALIVLMKSSRFWCWSTEPKQQVEQEQHVDRTNE